MISHVKTLHGHQNPIYALNCAPDDPYFYSAGNDKGIVEWAVDGFAFHKVTMPVQSSVYCLLAVGHLLISGERSGAFNVYDRLTDRLITRVNAHVKPIFDLKSIPGKNELITASEDGSVAVWSLTDFSERYRFEVGNGTVRTMAISPDGAELALGSKDTVIYLYDLADYSFKTSLEAHTLPITALAYHPLGNILVSGSRDAQLKIWDISGYALKNAIPAHLFAIYGILFHPTLPLMVTCSQDKSIKVWDMEKSRLLKIQSLEKSGFGHSHSVNKMIWSADESHLISAGDDRKIMIWKVD